MKHWKFWAAVNRARSLDWLSFTAAAMAFPYALFIAAAVAEYTARRGDPYWYIVVAATVAFRVALSGAYRMARSWLS